MELMKHKVLCIIPARAGSTRIPGKNLKLFHGKPIIQYSIETALESNLFGEIVVSTDSKETIELAKSLGITGEYRFKNLCENDVGTQRVGQSVMRDGRLGNKYVCILYATVPMLEAYSLSRGLTELMRNPGANFLYSVGPDGKDAGQFYWCQGEALVGGLPLESPKTIKYYVPTQTVCDINTPEDWEKALEMYQALKGAQA